MIRTRETLTLARFDRAHALLDSLPNDTSMLHRAPTHMQAPAPELARHYHRLSLREVDLGFAGRYAPGHSVHQNIAALATNAPIHLRQVKGRWELLDDNECTVGCLSRSFTHPHDMTCIEARVVAIINRCRDDSKPEYLDRVSCERWEVIIPELVFAPQ